MRPTTLTAKLASMTRARRERIKQRADILGSKRKRDVFEMIMRSEGCTFPEAVEILHANVSRGPRDDKAGV